jgi:hypothetical protein
MALRCSLMTYISSDSLSATVFSFPFVGVSHSGSEEIKARGQRMSSGVQLELLVFEGENGAWQDGQWHPRVARCGSSQVQAYPWRIMS